MNGNFISNIKVANKKDTSKSSNDKKSDFSFNIQKNNNKTIVSLGNKTNEAISKKLISTSHNGLLTPPKSNKPKSLKKNLSDTENWWFLDKKNNKSELL